MAKFGSCILPIIQSHKKAAIFSIKLIMDEIELTFASFQNCFSLGNLESKPRIKYKPSAFISYQHSRVLLFLKKKISAFKNVCLGSNFTSPLNLEACFAHSLSTPLKNKN